MAKNIDTKQIERSYQMAKETVSGSELCLYPTNSTSSSGLISGNQSVPLTFFGQNSIEQVQDPQATMFEMLEERNAIG